MQNAYSLRSKPQDKIHSLIFRSEIVSIMRLKCLNFFANGAIQSLKVSVSKGLKVFSLNRNIFRMSSDPPLLFHHFSPRTSSRSQPFPTLTLIRYWRMIHAGFSCKYYCTGTLLKEIFLGCPAIRHCFSIISHQELPLGLNLYQH